MIRRLKAIWPCRIAHIPVNTSRLQISPRSKNNCLTVIHRTGIGPHSLYPAILHKNFRHFRLPHRQMVRVLKHLSHIPGIFLLVRLGAQRVYRRSFGFIQHFGLNKGLVYILSHLSAQRIQLPHQMSLRAAANIRVTGHQSNTVHADRKHNRLQSQPRTSQGRLTAGMSRPDNYNIICLL